MQGGSVPGYLKAGGSFQAQIKYSSVCTRCVGYGIYMVKFKLPGKCTGWRRAGGDHVVISAATG